MPDLIDELRRYGDAAEKAVPSRDLPDPKRGRKWRSRAALAGAVAAAVVVLALWVGAPGDEAATVDTADEPTVDGDSWQIERVGVVDGAVSDEPVWFADRWWAVAPATGELLSSGDGSDWDLEQTALAPGVLLPFEGLAANEHRLLAVGVDDLGRIVTATTDDGATWKENVVGPSGVPDRELANVVAVAFDDALGIAVRMPTDAVVEALLANQRLSKLVQELVGSQPVDHHVDPETGLLHVKVGNGEEVFSGSPLELGLTESELEHIIAGLASNESTDTHDWQLHLSDDGDTWIRTELPADVRESAGVFSSGRALAAVDFAQADTLVTVDGRTWTPVDLSAASIEHAHLSGGVFRATGAAELWMLPDSESGRPALRANGVGEEFRSTGVGRATAVARSGDTVALLVDATPADPTEQEDLQAQWGWATAEFSWTDGTFGFTGSYTRGGTFTDHRTGRSWAIGYDDFVGSGTATELASDGLRFLDPDTGEVLLTIHDEFKDAIAEQHPQWADAVHGATVPDPTPPPAQLVRVALVGPGSEPTYVDLPPLLDDGIPVSLVAGPDDTFLAIAVTRVDGDSNQSAVAERTAFVIRRR